MIYNKYNVVCKHYEGGEEGEGGGKRNGEGGAERDGEGGAEKDGEERNGERPGVELASRFTWCMKQSRCRGMLHCLHPISVDPGRTSVPLCFREHSLQVFLLLLIWARSWPAEAPVGVVGRREGALLAVTGTISSWARSSSQSL